MDWFVSTFLQRFDYLVEMFKPASVVPSFLFVTDIAGLVKGASTGAGLGNAFLSHIQVRASLLCKQALCIWEEAYSLPSKRTNRTVNRRGKYGAICGLELFVRCICWFP
jgi:hypothetical protein